MRIGELSRRTGLTPSKIRFYEAQGLIRQVRRQGNGYRDYPAQAVQLLEIITSAQQSGFSLGEIRHLLPTPDFANWNREELLDPSPQGGGDRGAATQTAAEPGTVTDGDPAHGEQACRPALFGQCRASDGHVAAIRLVSGWPRWPGS